MVVVFGFRLGKMDALIARIKKYMWLLPITMIGLEISFFLRRTFRLRTYLKIFIFCG